MSGLQKITEDNIITLVESVEKERFTYLIPSIKSTLKSNFQKSVIKSLKLLNFYDGP